MSWRYYAACQGRDPEMFFPSGDNDHARRRLQEAKAVCAGCAVRSLCLEWSFLAGYEHGVWGGWSEDERRTPERSRVVQPVGWSVAPQLQLERPAEAVSENADLHRSRSVGGHPAMRCSIPAA